MIPARYEPLVSLFFTTLLMGLLISLAFELQATAGRTAGAGEFVQAWLWRFVQTYVVVVPLVLIINPVARRLAKLVVEKPAVERAD